MGPSIVIAEHRGFRAILKRFPDGAALAEALREDPATVSEWWQRNDIPPRFWPKLSWFALQSGVGGVTFITLSHIAVGQDLAKAEAWRSSAPGG